MLEVHIFFTSKLLFYFQYQFFLTKQEHLNLYIHNTYWQLFCYYINKIRMTVFPKAQLQSIYTQLPFRYFLDLLSLLRRFHSRCSLVYLSRSKSTLNKVLNSMIINSVNERLASNKRVPLISAPTAKCSAYQKYDHKLTITKSKCICGKYKNNNNFRAQKSRNEICVGGTYQVKHGSFIKHQIECFLKNLIGFLKTFCHIP